MRNLSKKKKIILLIGVILILAILQLVIIKVTQGEKASVKITVDGETYGTYDLAEDQTIRVETELGYNIVQIKDRTVQVIEADCKNQICVQTPKISEELSSVIACLPHEMIVEITQ